MLEQAELREQVQDLLGLERAAEAAYAQLVAKIEDPAIRQQFENLRHDKQRHIRLAERLLEILD
jgi:rubrerythrin